MDWRDLRKMELEGSALVNFLKKKSVLDKARELDSLALSKEREALAGMELEPLDVTT